MNKEQTCKERWKPSLASDLHDIRIMWRAQFMDGEERAAKLLDKHGLGPLNEYGLSLTYREPERGAPYFCWLLGTGGPHREFRFYADRLPSGDWRLRQIKYSFQDWFDGYTKALKSKVLADVFADWDETETLDYLFQKEQF